MKWRNRAAIAILFIGFFQMAGYAFKIPVLRGLGLASGVSPFPKVFSEADGYEAFAASFKITGIEENGKAWSRNLDAEWYSDIAGPYNRRNVYGAALAFAPRLSEDLRSEILDKALEPGSRLRAELRIPPNLRDLKIHITPRTGEEHGPWTFPEPTPPTS